MKNPLSSEIIDMLFVESAVYTFLAVIGTIGTTIFAYFRSIKKCVQIQGIEIDKIDKRSFRQSKALLLLASSLDKQTQRLHEDEQSTLFDDVERELKDSKGNF